MIRIAKTTKVRSDRGEQAVEVLFDTGAEDTYIRSDVAASLGNIIVLPEPVDMVLANGTTAGQITKTMTLFILVEGIWIKASPPYVVEQLAYPVVLGCPDMERYDIRPIPKNGSVTIPKPKTRSHLI